MHLLIREIESQIADLVHQLQGDQKGISLMGAPEDAELHRGGILEVEQV